MADGKFLMGFDVGSSSVKASLIEVDSGRCVASDFFPKSEAPIVSVRPGWAEQDPADWWDYLCQASRSVVDQAARQAAFDPQDVAAIGISWQMHGLVCVDKDLNLLRRAIIWCDSRAVPYGDRAFSVLGEDYCLKHLLNSPGNFTASKLAWVKDKEPEIFDRLYKIMLPGDYIALRMTGSPSTTVEGLSEGMLWDFSRHDLAYRVMDCFGFDHSIIPDIVPNFGLQGCLTAEAAAQLGLKEGVPLAYRAGDQPNNALSLKVLHPGEVASTAGTSGVVYGVNGAISCDPLSRVNSFAHVNHSKDLTRLGVLLCINGTGILNSWLRHHVCKGLSYDQMNQLAAEAPIGCLGLSVLPFGNGSERILGNRVIGGNVFGLSFTSHSTAHLLRAAQEGIVFSFRYGVDIMKSMGMDIRTIRAGHNNMFLSDIFARTLASVCDARIELFNTDGSMGAARGAGMGAGIYVSAEEAFATLHCVKSIEPDRLHGDDYRVAYDRWLDCLNGVLC